MKTIITAALTGGATPKSKTPYLPTTPKEIAEDAIKCCRAGAAVVHLHMRDENGEHCIDVERFREAMKRIRGECDAVINLTTNTQFEMTDEERLEHILQLKPELATFDPGTLNTAPEGVLSNSVPFLTKLGFAMQEAGTRPEIEIMDTGFLSITDYFIKQGVLKTPLLVNFALGLFNAMPATVENVVYLKNQIPKDTMWTAFGVGKAHLPILFATLSLGGNIRVGLEDNIYYSHGQLATNEQLTQRAVRIVNEFGNEVATPDDVRSMLNLRAPADI